MFFFYEADAPRRVNNDPKIILCNSQNIHKEKKFKNS